MVWVTRRYLGPGGPTRIRPAPSRRPDRGLLREDGAFGSQLPCRFVRRIPNPPNASRASVAGSGTTGELLVSKVTNGVMLSPAQRYVAHLLRSFSEARGPVHPLC